MAADEWIEQARDPYLELQVECQNCGAPIDVTVILEGAAEAPREFAVTCDSCGRSVWMTFTPVTFDTVPVADEIAAEHKESDDGG